MAKTILGLSLADGSRTFCRGLVLDFYSQKDSQGCTLEGLSPGDAYSGSKQGAGMSSAKSETNKERHASMAWHVPVMPN